MKTHDINLGPSHACPHTHTSHMNAHYTYTRKKEKRFFSNHPSTGPFSILNTHAKNFWTHARMLNEGSAYQVIKSKIPPSGP